MRVTLPSPKEGGSTGRAMKRPKKEAGIGNDDRLYVPGYSGTRLAVWRFWP